AASSLHFRAEHPIQSSFPTRRSSDLCFVRESATAQEAAAPARRLIPSFPLLFPPASPPAWKMLDSRRRAEYNGRIQRGKEAASIDRKSTRLNSSHVSISYAVFCLKKK